MNFMGINDGERSFRTILAFLRVLGLTPFTLVGPDEKGCREPSIGEPLKWLVYHYLVVTMLAAQKFFVFCFNIINRETTGIDSTIFSMGNYAYTVTTTAVVLTFLCRRDAIRHILQRTAREWAGGVGPPLMMADAVGHFLWAALLTLPWAPVDTVEVRHLATFSSEITLLLVGALTTLYSSMLLIQWQCFKSLNERLLETGGQQSAAELSSLLNRHSQLWAICQDLNTACGPAILAFFGLCAIEFLINLNETIKRFGKLNAATLVWSSCFTTKLIYTLTAASMASNEAKKAGWLVPTSSIYGDEDTNNVIIEFHLNEQHHDLNLDSCGLFVISIELLCPIMGTLMTYAAILYQFRSQSC